MFSYLCSLCSNSGVQINARRYRMQRLLGDGGYAYVYLVSEPGTPDPLALKKIRCMFGGESVANATREIEAGRVFRYTPRVVSSVDSAIVQEEDGTKTVYIVMPYYSGGSLQDRINEHVVAGTSFSESEVVKIALSVARALEVMHTNRTSEGSDPATSSGGGLGDDPATLGVSGSDRDALLSHAEDIALEELEPYAHRDVKPANVMFDSGGEAVLIDLGFCSPARVVAASRREAVQLQDLAAEHCTLPFRAPELFDVRTGSAIDEKVDVWAFGCLLYATMYGVSPFEHAAAAGASINIAIARANFTFPDEPDYSEALRDVVSMCIRSVPSERAAMADVVARLEELECP